APVGVAFQLRDDLLGAFGSPADTGKPAFGDLRAGRRTALVSEAERLLDRDGRHALSRVLGNADADVRSLRAATAALADCGAAAAVIARLASLCTRAEKLAAALPLTARARDVLCGAATALRWTPDMGAAFDGRPAARNARAHVRARRRRSRRAA